VTERRRGVSKRRRGVTERPSRALINITNHSSFHIPRVSVVAPRRRPTSPPRSRRLAFSTADFPFRLRARRRSPFALALAFRAFAKATPRILAFVSVLALANSLDVGRRVTVRIPRNAPFARSLVRVATKAVWFS